MTQKTKALIIRETKEYYASDPSRRSYVKFGNGHINCRYNGPNGKKCAFARYVKENKTYKLQEGVSASTCIEDLGVSILKDEYQIEDLEFWNRLQRLHDRSIYWDEKGLTDTGVKFYIELLKTYS